MNMVSYNTMHILYRERSKLTSATFFPNILLLCISKMQSEIVELYVGDTTFGLGAEGTRRPRGACVDAKDERRTWWSSVVWPKMS